jgi:hypothetical protein
MTEWRRALMFTCHWALALVIMIPLIPTVHREASKIQWYDLAQTMDTRMHYSNQRPEESHQYHPAHLPMLFGQRSILYTLISLRAEL